MAVRRALALAALLSAPRPIAWAAVGDRIDAHRINKHNLQPYLRVLTVGDGSTALPAPPSRGGERPEAWPDPWAAHAPEPPLTYRKALWQVLSRRERLAVQFIGSQQDDRITSIAGNGGLHEGYGGATVEQLANGALQPARSKWLSALGTRHPPDVAIICAGYGDLHRRPEAARGVEDLLSSLTSLVKSLHRNARSNTTTLVCRIPLPEGGATCKVAGGCPLLEAVLKANRMLPAWAAELEQTSRHPVRLRVQRQHTPPSARCCTQKQPPRSPCP